ncbi:hypothetical protein ACFP1I_05795 [Dyadobacter subterraneus]|uniref:Uncharacterized protein n=1 Tax=Dyadobacter subterraneus TaxID=2773304 RepID=A0ABR9WG08_9BACT|nr:hypothetical protein [Dyadobacter subterraneus]MBE9464357.1 hypothetical protein [Dyadobacter subterraneus]
MQVTYTLPADSLNENFLEQVKDSFAGKKVNIIIEDVNETVSSDQSELFKKMEILRKRIGQIKVDPDLDLSSLANEVNL